MAQVNGRQKGDVRMVQHATPSRRLPKRTKIETQALLLRAAVDLLRERALSEGDDVVAAALAHVRVADIAARATQIVRDELAPDRDHTQDPDRDHTQDPDQGHTHDHTRAASVTTGAAYQIWPRQADLQADLLFHIAEQQATLVPSAAEMVQRFRAASSAGVPLEDTVLSTAEEIWADYRDDPLFRVELSFLVAATNPRVRAALAHRRQAFAASADQVWQGLLDAYGRRMRPPYRLPDLTTAIAAQISGSVVLWWADPQVLDDPGRGSRSLTARVVAMLVDELTEPA